MKKKQCFYMWRERGKWGRKTQVKIQWNTNYCLVLIAKSKMYFCWDQISESKAIWVAQDFEAWQSCRSTVYKILIITALEHFQQHTCSQGDVLVHIFWKHYIKLPNVSCVELSTEWAKLWVVSSEPVGKTLFGALYEAANGEGVQSREKRQWWFSYDPRVNQGKKTDGKCSPKWLHTGPR